MNISPVRCPDTSCYWSAFGIPDQYTEARDWHLAVHRAEEHDEPLTEEQVAYATRVGHVIPGTARTTAAAVAAMGALPVPVGDQPQPLDDQRLAEALDAYEGHPDLGFACCSAHAVADHVPALRAEVQRLKADQADVDTVANRATQVITSMGAEIRALKQERNRYRLAWQSASERAQARGEGILRITRDRETYQGWLEQEQIATQRLRARVAELESERHSTNESLSDAAEALREMRDRLAEYERPADAYPPALPWARHMDDEDLIEFLAELAGVMQDARHVTTLAGHVHARRILDGLEKACGTWRLIAEAQHAHNTAPGPDADQPGMRHAARTTTPTAQEATR